MKKYLFVVPSLSHGGAERVVSILADQTAKSGREAVVAVHFEADDPYAADGRVRVINLSGLREAQYRERFSAPYFLYLIHRLRRVIAEEHPDYILPFLWTTCIRVDLARRFLQPGPVILQTVRNNPESFPENRWLKLYRNHLVAKAPGTIVQTERQKAYFPKRHHDRIHILPNPVSDEAFGINRTRPRAGYRIVAAGRLERQKNYPLLIRAFRDVSESQPEIYLEIFGSGSQETALREEIANLGLEHRITLKGRSSQLQEIYGEADLYVMTSDFEGMPNTLMEAMACGLPCISTDCPTGPSDLIRDGETGLIVPVGDRSGLAKAMAYALENQADMERMGAAGRKYMQERYRADRIGRRLWELCERIEL